MNSGDDKSTPQKTHRTQRLILTMAPTLTIKCPQCQQIYIDWHTPAVSISTSEFRPTVVCSQCGHRAALEDLSKQDGIWQQKAASQPSPKPH